jgi:hypothetical protein
LECREDDDRGGQGLAGGRSQRVECELELGQDPVRPVVRARRGWADSFGETALDPAR